MPRTILARPISLRISSVVVSSPRKPAGSLSTMTRSGLNVTAAARMTLARSAVVCSMSRLRDSETYSASTRLDDARHADVVDAGREGEAAGDRRSGQDKRRRAFERGNERFGDGARAPQMAEPERVVTVEQDMRGAVGLLDSVTHAMIPLRINWPRNWNSVSAGATIRRRERDL